jgi:hypothetical protein
LKVSWLGIPLGKERKVANHERLAWPKSSIQIAGIERMERGTLCRIREGPRGPYFNHQRWEDGRNVVRYVPREQIPALKSAIEGYRRFRRLTEAYAEQIIRRTRKQARPTARTQA